MAASPVSGRDWSRKNELACIPHVANDSFRFPLSRQVLEILSKDRSASPCFPSSHSNSTVFGKRRKSTSPLLNITDLNCHEAIAYESLTGNLCSTFAVQPKFRAARDDEMRTDSRFPDRSLARASLARQRVLARVAD